jgi:hypothetical protein
MSVKGHRTMGGGLAKETQGQATVGRGSRILTTQTHKIALRCVFFCSALANTTAPASPKLACLRSLPSLRERETAGTPV